MKAFDIGCDGELIGRYYGDTEEEAISEFKSELSWARKSGIDIGLTSRQLLNSLIVVEVK